MLTLEGRIKTRALYLPKLRLRILTGLKHYLLSVSLVWLAIAFYRLNQYYHGLLRPETQVVLLFLAIIYSVFGLVFYVVVPAEKLPKSRGLVVFQALKRMSIETKDYLNNFAHSPSLTMPKLKTEEKTAILFLFVKLFFLPLMINYLFSNFDAVRGNLSSGGGLSHLFTVQGFNQYFPMFISLLFFIDVAYFTFGYMVEARFLNNTVRSVEPTILGWVVALICYEPFNNILNNYASWYANDNIYVPSRDQTFVLHLVVLILLGIYASASVALGAKASNLTNRGIVSRGPYRWVRHPAYTAKNLAWWVTIIPVFSLSALLSMAVWSSVYFMRAITEERHLLRDPEYQAYVKKVRFRFIPGVW